MTTGKNRSGREEGKGDGSEEWWVEDKGKEEGTKTGKVVLKEKANKKGKGK